MRRVAYHAAINVALALGRIQDIARFEMANAGDNWLALPWFTASLIVWSVFRPTFILAYRLAFYLADGLPPEQRERLQLDPEEEEHDAHT